MPGTDRVEIRTLKVGRFCVVDDEAYKILSISKSKPGKHGSAKARLSLESIFTGKKISHVGTVTDSINVPMIEKGTARSMMVNLVGVQHLTQALASLLQGEHRTRVTTISSGAALRPLASWSAYCTAKAGLDMWTRCLAEEGGQHNITAVSVAPGIVNTGMQTAIRSASPEDFPLLENFVGYHENGQLADAETVAEALYGLITSHTEEQSGQRFDVRDL